MAPRTTKNKPYVSSAKGKYGLPALIGHLNDSAANVYRQGINGLGSFGDWISGQQGPKPGQGLGDDIYGSVPSEFPKPKPIDPSLTNVKKGTDALTGVANGLLQSLQPGDPDFLTWLSQNSGMFNTNPASVDTSSLDNSYDALKSATTQEYNNSAAAIQSIYNQLAQMNAGDAKAQQAVTNGQVAEDQAINKATAANINAGYDSAQQNQNDLAARLGIAPNTAANASNEANRAQDVSNAATNAGNAETYLNETGANQANWLGALPSANRTYGANAAAQELQGLAPALAQLDAANQQADAQYRSQGATSPLDLIQALLPVYQQEYGSPDSQEQLAYDQAQASAAQQKESDSNMASLYATYAKLAALKNPTDQDNALKAQLIKQMAAAQQ